MGSQSRNDVQEGSARDVERRTGMDFNLNFPPPDEFIDLTGLHEGSAIDVERRTGMDFDLNCPPPDEFIDPIGSHEEAAQHYNHNQEQAMDNHDIIDDDIAIISPQKFVEARKKFRRIHNESSCGVDVNNGNAEVYGALSDITSGPPLTISNSISIIQQQTIQNLDTEATVDTNSSSALAQSRSSSPPAAVRRFQCPICIEPLVDGATTKCGHIFCRSCLQTAIATQHKCPVCRHKLRKRDIIRIFLPVSP